MRRSRVRLLSPAPNLTWPCSISSWRATRGSAILTIGARESGGPHPMHLGPFYAVVPVLLTVCVRHTIIIGRLTQTHTLSVFLKRPLLFDILTPRFWNPLFVRLRHSSCSSKHRYQEYTWAINAFDHGRPLFQRRDDYGKPVASGFTGRA